MKNLTEIISEANVPEWHDNQYLIVGAFVGEKPHINDYVSYKDITNAKWLIPVLFGEDNEDQQDDWMKEYADEIIEKIQKEKDNKDFSLCYQGDGGYIMIFKGTAIVDM